MQHTVDMHVAAGARVLHECTVLHSDVCSFGDRPATINNAQFGRAVFQLRNRFPESAVEGVEKYLPVDPADVLPGSLA